jgi:hypothetical protein
MRKKNLPQAIAEDLIIPFALKIAKHLLSSETQKKIQQILQAKSCNPIED